METRANYVLIGAFTLAGFVGLLLFFMWFARVELDRQFAYYDVEFPTVAGLSTASEVRFSGLPVGQVVEVRLSPDQTGRVRVRIEVDAETPVRTSTVATIESQGVTGLSFVGLSAGDPRDPLLQPEPGDEVALIPSGRSVLQTLSEDAPAIIEEVLGLTQQLGNLLGPENQARVTSILENLEQSSGNLGQALDDFSSVTDTIASSSEEIAAFTSRLETISAAAVEMLETADITLVAVTDLAKRAEQSLETGDAALESGRATLDSANAFIRDDLPRLVTDLTEAAYSVRQQVDEIGIDARAMLEEFRKTGTLASARLEQAEATLTAADTMLADMSRTLASVEAAAGRFDTFLAEDGTALVAEARKVIAEAGRVATSAATFAETDLPAIMADIREATETAAGVVDSVGTDLSAAASRVDGISEDMSATLDTVTETFVNANDTLARLNTALDTGDSALAAADRAFTSADRVLNDEVGQMTEQLRGTLTRLDDAISQVVEDVPAITADLRQTAEQATAAAGEVQRTAASLGPPLRDFADSGLPQYTVLAREMRDLVDNLDRLVTRIDRDPARYFLGRDEPVFRR